MSTQNGTMIEAGPRSLALKTLDDYMRFGDFVASTSFAPKEMRGKPIDCAVAVILGAEIGVGPMAALQGIAVINGKPSVYGDLLLAIVKASPLCEWVNESMDGEGDSMTARCEAKRQGYQEATVATFSMADAKRAGLLGKDGPWKQYPTRMLQMRARGFALRDAFPDVLRGVISREEAEDYPSDQAPAQRRAPQRKISQEKPVVIDARPEPAATSGETPQAIADCQATDAVPAVGVVEKALAAVAGCDSFDTLAEFQLRVDAYLVEKRVNKAEHDAITSAIDQRADYLRSIKAMGEPPDAKG